MVTLLHMAKYRAIRREKSMELTRVLYHKGCHPSQHGHVYIIPHLEEQGTAREGLEAKELPLRRGD
jgi:hypothetical protein